MNMEHTELKQALEELCFWRDFARIWDGNESKSVEPRVLEALKNAENRYLSAIHKVASTTGV